MFSAQSVRGDTIKEDQEYEGLRLNLDCRLENARIPIQIDIGFGDVVTPAAAEVTYPVLLDFPAPVLPAYSRESVVAEKFQAMVMLGIANSRMKDFYDLWVLARQFEFQGPVLCQAIRATFERGARRFPPRRRWPCRPSLPRIEGSRRNGGRLSARASSIPGERDWMRSSTPCVAS